MDRDHIDVITSHSARVIRGYCQVLARVLGLTLMDVRWTSDLYPDHDEASYRLVLTITESFTAMPEYSFTRTQVVGYDTGQSRDAVQRTRQQDLTARLDEIR